MELVGKDSFGNNGTTNGATGGVNEVNSYKSGVPSAPIRLSKTGGAPGSSMGQQSVTGGPPLPPPRLQIDHSCDDEDDNYLPLDSFR